MSKIITINVSILLLSTMFILGGLLETADGAAVAVIVPYSSVPVADEDLDGYSTTGAWDDANIYTVDLENRENPPYGTATVYLKHDGTYIYIRIDGKIDVPWIDETSDHFWIGFQINPSETSGHHRSVQDTIFFGQTSYSGITYPLTPIDTHGGAKPPARDTSQDAYGMARYSGTAPPYDFTAEWKRKLDTGDGEDVLLVADGTTTYYFYITTDSNGGGSSGGKIDHSGTTNHNTMRIATAAVPEFPLGTDILMAIAFLMPLIYLWKIRQKRSVYP